MTAPSLLAAMGGAVPSGAAPTWLRIALVAAALVLLLVVGLIDARHRIIPNALNAALAGLGLVAAGSAGLEPLVAAAAQGVVALGLFWLFRVLYRLLRGVQGLGFGDVKFMGAAGVWVGLGGIAPVTLIACLAAIAYVAVARLRGAAITRRSAVPFGPFLALGLAAVLIAEGFWPATD